jgi:small-conductance mechanosensitive channel
MALNIDLSPLARVVESFSGGATHAELLYEAGVAAIGLLLAWIVARSLRRRVKTGSKWKFGKGGFERVAVAWLALAFVWGAKLYLAGFQRTDLLGIVVTLLLAYAVIRTSIYVLGHVIPEGGLQHAVIRAVHWAAWIVVALYVAGILPDAIAFLEAHGFTFGKNKTGITLLDLLKGAIALFLTVTLALYLSRITESRVLGSENLEMTTRVVIAKVVRITVFFIAIFIALPLAGIDVTTLSIFGGALGVGLGFGLQKIASNYVSGFIVLLDRSLRIGDVVTVDGKRGEVRAIETRFTVIKGDNGVESIIPNEKLITESVQHHTYSDTKVSVVVGVWISYESDVVLACDVLAGIAHGHKRVIADPAPLARVKQLGDNGIELELTVWISDPAAGEADLKSALYKDILRRFPESRIEIPYPRREIRMLATPEMRNFPATSST